MWPHVKCVFLWSYNLRTFKSLLLKGIQWAEAENSRDFWSFRSSLCAGSKWLHSFTSCRDWGRAKIRPWHRINSSGLSKPTSRITRKYATSFYLNTSLAETCIRLLTGNFLLKSYSSVACCVVSSSSELIFFPKLAWASLDSLNERWGIDKEIKWERIGLRIQEMDSLHVLGHDNFPNSLSTHISFFFFKFLQSLLFYWLLKTEV